MTYKAEKSIRPFFLTFSAIIDILLTFMSNSAEGDLQLVKMSLLWQVIFTRIPL